MIDKDNIKQVKLANGDEVVCEIISFDEEELLVTRALRLASTTILSEEDQTVYVFRPWMTYSTNIDETVIVNPNSIICFARPGNMMEIQYLDALNSIRVYSKELEESYKDFERERKKDSVMMDSCSSNVVELFTGKDTLH